MMAQILGNSLMKRGWKIAVAESCTGGLIGHLITNVPASSRYFLGDVVAYSNEAKLKILGVKEIIIDKYGAVSRECAEEMVKSVVKLFKANVGISTTGIAGPVGTTAEKPVGLAYIGLLTPKKIVVNRYIFKGRREEIKEKIALKALEDIVNLLEK